MFGGFNVTWCGFEISSFAFQKGNFPDNTIPWNTQMKTKYQDRENHASITFVGFWTSESPRSKPTTTTNMFLGHKEI
jgi:hypothetical protein